MNFLCSQSKLLAPLLQGCFDGLTQHLRVGLGSQIQSQFTALKRFEQMMRLFDDPVFSDQVRHSDIVPLVRNQRSLQMRNGNPIGKSLVKFLEQPLQKIIPIEFPTAESPRVVHPSEQRLALGIHLVVDLHRRAVLLLG